MEILPLGDRVVVEVAESPKHTSGGLILPDIARDNSTSGVVVAAGKDCQDVWAGDTVFFSEYVGTHFQVGLIDYLIMHEIDIVAVAE